MTNIQLWFLWVFNPIKVTQEFMIKFMKEFAPQWKFDNGLDFNYHSFQITFWKGLPMERKVLMMNVYKGDKIYFRYQSKDYNYNSLVELKKALKKMS